MLAIQRILHPTDFSDCALQALGHALQLSRRHHADLHVLHVVEEDAADPLSEEEARSAMRHLLEAHGYQGGARRIVMRASTAAAQILRHASEHDVDVIVMGTHGRTPHGAMLVGGVAEAVILGAPCPVLAVRHRAQSPIPGAAGRIVVPVDYGPEAGLAIRCARELAAEEGGTVVLLHVAEAAATPDDAYQLFRLLEDSPGPAVPVELHVLQGRPEIEIAAFAGRTAASLIVVPMHGGPLRERGILGGVAEKVLGRAPCPVLMLRPDATLPDEREPATAGARAADEIC